VPIRSLQYGMSGAAVGMMGKVFGSGALAVVQNVAIVPGCVHPRDKLDSAFRAPAAPKLPRLPSVTPSTSAVAHECVQPGLHVHTTAQH